jgi:ABC-type antimicrobial peptide transport system permease subunit
LTALEAVYKRFNPEYPFTFRFMDDAYEQTYRSEIIISTLASISAVLAILIACLGLFGLASFTVEQRSKEIGIRKVLGASVTKVVLVLSREFVLLVIGAYAVATPIAYYVMSIWLEDFTFHTEVSVGILAGAGIVSVLISGLTVSYQSLKAATANPVASLRSE